MPEYSKKQKETFLEVLEAKGGNVSQACEATGVSRRTFYLWLEKLEWFKDAYDDMMEAELDESESLHRMHRRGIRKYKYVAKTVDGIVQYDALGRAIWVRARDENGEPIPIGWIVEPKQSAVEFHLKTRGKKRGWSEVQDDIPPILLNFELNPQGEKPESDEELPPDPDTGY